MWQPHSVRSQIAAVFVFFFALVAGLGLFSISQLSSFNKLSSNVAEIWLPTTRALGDLNNFTSDFRAIEGGHLLLSEASEIASAEKEMEGLDRAIAQSERNFERISHDQIESAIYDRFKERWNDYRARVNQMLVLSRTNRKAEALAIHKDSLRKAYNSANDALAELTDRAVANSRAASDHLAVAYRRALWLIWFAIGVAGLMVVGALLYIGRNISKPLLQLADRMRRLASNDTNISILGTERRDEIGEMARAAVIFRGNAMKLIDNQQVLAEQASMLKEQLEQEQRLAQLQRNFVSMVSHEFRTPLTHIDGNARRLLKMKDRLEAEEVGERAGKIRGAVLRLTHLIDNLLCSSRLTENGGALGLQTKSVDLTKLLQDVCQLHREINPGASIVEQAIHAPLWVSGDSELLHHLFCNLLSNAIKYSPDGKAVEIGTHLTSGHVAVSVADQGIGIPQEDRGHLFKRYYRGSNVSGVVGAGVGLHLVKMVADLHGAKVEVESDEGQGSRFTVWLPRIQ